MNRSNVLLLLLLLLLLLHLFPPPQVSFSNKRRAQIKAEFPTASNHQVNVMLAFIWDLASDAQRASYEQAYQLEMQHYREKMAQWENGQQGRNDH
jgi:HMG (high mobility group) box